MASLVRLRLATAINFGDLVHLSDEVADVLAFFGPPKAPICFSWANMSAAAGVTLAGLSSCGSFGAQS
jgi:hypothetical protein